MLAEEYISTTFVNLIANEERFDNQLIATYGVFCKAYEGKVAIYPDEGSCNNLVTFNSIELKFPNGKKSDFFSEDDLGKYVAVKGYYLKKHPWRSHIGYLKITAPLIPFPLLSKKYVY